MMSTYRKIHNRFKLNGLSYSYVQLKEMAYNLIKEGEAFEKEIGDFLLDWMDNKNTLEVRTSGSTGKPKLISLQKNHMVNSALATGEFFGLQPGDTALLCLPATYIAGKMMLVRAMVLGLELDYRHISSNPLQFNYRCYDFCAMVPLQLENSLKNIEQVKTLLVGGTTITRTLYGRIRNQIKTQHYKTEIFETYGMTETITHIALKKVHVGSGAGEAQVPNTFKTLPNVSVSKDDRGCLIILAPKITEGPVITNDRVDLTSATEFEWLGRYDNIINSGGVKLFPEQIEAKLEALLSLRFFVTGLPDKSLGQKLVLIVEGEMDTDELLQEIRSLKTLEKFEVPKEIYAIEKFQETDNGKILRSKTLSSI